MILKRIEVKNLFGIFHHVVNFKETDITLLLGENGIGKTIILKILKALFDNNFDEIESYVFDEFILSFQNQTLFIKRQVSKDNFHLAYELFDLDNNKIGEYRHKRSRGLKARQSISFRSSSQVYYGRFREVQRELEYLLDIYFPNKFERIRPDVWIDNVTNVRFTTKELISKYSESLPENFLERLEPDVEPWLVDLTKTIKIKFIEAQRLLVASDEGKYRSSVVGYSNQLVQTIKEKRSLATDLASKLDRTYPNRLINMVKNPTDINSEELIDNLNSLQNKREFLRKTGLLDTQDESIPPISDNEIDSHILKEVLQVYIKDSNEKLSIYDDLSNKINLLLEIINKRFIHKKLSIHKEKGFVFRPNIEYLNFEGQQLMPLEEFENFESNSGVEIPLTGLSSGEQHELVLFFELLFNTEKNSLLLIDEPEISLHISWQKQFIKDLSEVIKVNNLSVIIATQSPDIIGNYWDLTVSL